VNGIVVFCKRLFEEFLPHAVELAEALGDEAEKLVVGTLLRAALDDHGRHLSLQAWG